jgi:predicted aldo/keto reductase-like oxidoreductase
MTSNHSRREFLALGLAFPATGLASATDPARGPLPSVSPPSPASPPKLAYRTLGKTGLEVTTVGFGCMTTSDATVIERAADLGINYFDTARVYQQGNNERMVGAALKRKRKDIVLSTKTITRDKQGALADLETSLRELGTDYVDIWYLHLKNTPADVTDDLLDAQRIAKQQGKIRFSGVSTHEGYQELIPLVAKEGTVDVVLTMYNFSMEKAVGEAIAEASEAGIGIVGMKTMAGGFRRRPAGPPPSRPGGPPPGGPPPGGRPPRRRPEPPAQLNQQGAMLAALKWVIRDPNVHTTIPGMQDMEQLDENLRAMAEPYGPAEEKLLARQLELITPLYCRTCGKCRATCAKGLPVADILRYLSYADGYGQFALAREQYATLPRELADVRCRDCERCTVDCPYGVQVAARLSRAQELFA